MIGKTHKCYYSYVASVSQKCCYVVYVYDCMHVLIVHACFGEINTLANNYLLLNLQACKIFHKNMYEKTVMLVGEI